MLSSNTISQMCYIFLLYIFYDNPVEDSTTVVKPEKENPPPSNSSVFSASSHTVVDGSGSSKPETKSPVTLPAKEPTSSGFLAKTSIFKSNKPKKEPVEKKATPPAVFTSKIKQEYTNGKEPASPTLHSPHGHGAEEFNSIERGEKLSHLTASRVSFHPSSSLSLLSRLFPRI